MTTADTLAKMDALLDDLDALLGDLPLRNDKRKHLSKMLFDFWESVEDEVCMPSADWEA